MSFPWPRLSPAEQSAMRLDGESWPFGGSSVLLGEPLDTATRLAAALPTFTDGLVLVGLSAAWVWGALASPPPTCHVARADGTRIYVSAPRNVRVRDLLWSPGDIVPLRSGAVTSVIRTVTDIARYETNLSPVDLVDVLARLCGTQSGTSDLVIARLISSEHLPHKARALTRIRAARERLALAHPVDVVHGVNASHGAQ